MKARKHFIQNMFNEEESRQPVTTFLTSYFHYICSRKRQQLSYSKNQQLQDKHATKSHQTHARKSPEKSRSRSVSHTSLPQRKTSCFCPSSFLIAF